MPDGAAAAAIITIFLRQFGGNPKERILMARSVNKVILIGNLGNDPETKYTQGGMAVTKISLATTSVRKDKEGNTQERTEWHRVTFFGKLGEIAGEYLRKGSQVYVEGSIRYDKFTGQDGVEKYYTDIIADDMQMLGGRGEGGGGGERSARPPRQESNRQESAPQRRPAPAQAAPADDFSDDDIPF
jgi:single-strand DNA-binding protein